MCEQNPGKFLQDALVFGGKPVGRRGVDVQDAQLALSGGQRHHDFGVAGRVAGDVAGELVDVGDSLDRLGREGRTADAPVIFDVHAGHVALEGTEDQVIAGRLIQVEAGPVDIGDRLHQERGGVREVRHQVGFTME